MPLGNGILGIGLLLMGFALPLGVRASETGGRGWSIAALILAVSVLPFPTGAAFAPEATAPVAASEVLSEEYDVSRSDAQVVLERAIDAGVVSISPGPGSYVATFGALLDGGRDLCNRPGKGIQTRDHSLRDASSSSSIVGAGSSHSARTGLTKTTCCPTSAPRGACRQVP